MKLSLKLLNNKALHFFFLLGTLLILFAVPQIVFAQTAVGVESQFSPVEANLEIPIPYVNFKTVVKNGKHITVPFLSQYISGVYQFLLSIVGVVAGVYILIGGFIYLTAGGNGDRVKKARNRIVNAVMGLVLAFGSYILLFSINPALVTFEALKFEFIEADLSLLEPEEGGDENDPPPLSFSGKSKPKSLCSSKTACEILCADPNSWPSFTEGMADPGDVVRIPAMPGVVPRGFSALPQTIKGLKEAGRRASAKGLFISVRSGYRPLKNQISKVCAKYKAGKHGDVPGFVAYPGGSFHGTGVALDLQLWNTTPKSKCKFSDGCIVTSSSSQQNKSEFKDGARQLAEIMIASGFRRYKKEIWHFELKDAPSASCRCDTVESCPYAPNVKC